MKRAAAVLDPDIDAVIVALARIHARRDHAAEISRAAGSIASELKADSRPDAVAAHATLLDAWLKDH